MNTATNQKAQKGAKVTKRRTRKNVARTHTVDMPKTPENWLNVDSLTVSTTCPTFGSPLLDEAGNIVTSDGMSRCKKCLSNVKSACIIKADPAISHARKLASYEFIKVYKNGKKRGAVRQYIITLINREKYTKKQLIDLVKKTYPESKPTVPAMYMRHGMKGKGSDAKRFDYRIIENKKGHIVFDKTQPKGSWGQDD